MSQKVAEKIQCELCDYICCKKSDMNKHILTRKHKNRINRTENLNKIAETKYVCSRCNKEYSARNSLWYHNKKCKQQNEVLEINTPVTNTNTNDTMLFHLLAQNKELMELLITQNKEIQKCPTTINQTNNKFNINVFLNETCKNAMNFSDFVNNIQITYEDLENNAKLGFVNGISKIFLDNLNQLDISERPIHCTDVKRETMYIRDDNTWKKQTDDQILQKAIQAVSYKSMGKLAKWKEENPDYKDADSEFSQRCLTIQKHTLAGSERGVYYPKVIHALARETVVEKT